MGFFSTSSPFDADVEKVTPEEDRSTEDWGSMLDICDKIGDSPQNAKDCLKSIMRRLNNPNPHVVLKAITLLDVCVKNCLRVLLLEIASREFEQEYRKILKKTMQQQPKVADQLKLLLKKWVENEFRSDPQLSLIPSLYSKLKEEGVDFSNLTDNSTKSNLCSTQLKDPNAAASQQEVEDIAKAIELSLKVSSASGSNNLYPSTINVTSAGGSKSYSQNNAPKQKMLVKALYDFEAAEDNELTFHTGEILEIIDDSDKNWWKGANKRGEGLFPANFVTTDLSWSNSSELEKKTEQSDKKNHVKFSDSVSVHENLQENVVINEQKIDRLLHLLHETNPINESADTEEMLKLEEEVNAMGPLIDNELEKVDRKHVQLTQLSSSLVEAFNLYHEKMRKETFLTGRPPCETTYIPPMSVQQHTLPHPHSMMYHSSNINGRYSLPPGINNEQYAPNSVPPMGQPTSGVHHQINWSSRHFVPITTIPVQTDSYLHPNMVTSPPASTHSFAPNVDPSHMPMQYNMQPSNLLPPQQVSQNLFQPMQSPLISQESLPSGATGFPSNPRI